MKCCEMACQNSGRMQATKPLKTVISLDRSPIIPPPSPPGSFLLKHTKKCCRTSRAIMVNILNVSL